jgi:hypothetical protein
MSPTLADVYMITGLKVTRIVYPYKYKGSSKETGVKTGVGYKRYIQNHISDGPLTDVEYRVTKEPSRTFGENPGWFSRLGLLGPIGPGPMGRFRPTDF